MKIIRTVHADRNLAVYLAGCPACDLPIEMAVSSRVGDVLTWHRGETLCDTCPRCGEPLPSELPDPEPVAA